jgi:hypothetical protein
MLSPDRTQHGGWVEDCDVGKCQPCLSLSPDRTQHMGGYQGKWFVAFTRVGGQYTEIVSDGIKVSYGIHLSEYCEPDFWGLKACWAFTALSSRPPICECKAGHRWTESSMRLSIRIYWLGKGDRDRWALLQRSWVFLAELLTFVMRARNERRMWIACRWPNPSVK